MPDTTPILEAQVCACGHLRSEHEPSVRQAYLWRNIGPFVCVHTSKIGPHGLDDDGWPDVCMCTEFVPACPHCHEGIQGEDDQRCAECDGSGRKST